MLITAPHKSALYIKAVVFFKIQWLLVLTGTVDTHVIFIIHSLCFVLRVQHILYALVIFEFYLQLI
jgi:hypothetical protein